jgi:hypothetical protein
MHSKDLSPCSRCGELPYLKKIEFIGGKMAVLSPMMRLKHDAPDVAVTGWGYICDDGCGKLVGPAPTLSLLDELWELLNKEGADEVCCM